MKINSYDYSSITSDERYWRSTNLYLCAFLFCKEFELVNVDKLSLPDKAVFVFRNTPELELSAHQYQFSKEDSPDVLVDARKFVTAIKAIKDNLYHDKF